MVRVGSCVLPGGYTLRQMRTHTFIVLLVLTLVGLGPSSATRAVTPQNAPLTDAQIEAFLRTARVLRSRDIGKGVTGAVRATLSDGALTHDAQIQSIDEAKKEFRGQKGVEFDFRDSWQFNIAAYRIDRLLELQLVPVSVERNWRRGGAAFTWWIDDVLMDEGERLKQQLSPADSRCWNEQTHLVRMLDQLIDNSDRNMGNMLIATNWRVWAIDHTRAFRYARAPRSPAQLTGIDRTVLKRLEALDFAVLKRAIEGHISDADIRNLLSRRDGIVAYFTAREALLYDRRDPVAGCSLGDEGGAENPSAVESRNDARTSDTTSCDVARRGSPGAGRDPRSAAAARHLSGSRHALRGVRGVRASTAPGWRPRLHPRHARRQTAHAGDVPVAIDGDRSGLVADRSSG